MECYHCNTAIEENEKYYCWTITIERCNGDVITVDDAVGTKVLCMSCAGKKPKKEIN